MPSCLRSLGLIRTALFVPGTRADRVDKAVSSAADAVIVDLEDAVAVAQKEEARATAREKIAHHAGRKLFVRVNDLGSEFLLGDLEAIVVDGLSGIVVPKVESPLLIQEVHRLLLATENRKGLTSGSILVIPLIESAKGVQNVFEIASVHTEPHRILTVAFGAADYALDLGIELTKDGQELWYSRSRIAIACRSAGIDPPLDTPYLISLRDEEGLRNEACRAKQLGFQGKLCIHPNQLDICNSVFSPSDAEIAFAKKVIEVFAESEAEGVVSISIDGKFVDYAVFEKAKQVLKLAQKLHGPDKTS